MSLALDAAIAANRHFSTVMSRRSLNPAAFPPPKYPAFISGCPFRDGGR